MDSDDEEMPTRFYFDQHKQPICPDLFLNEEADLFEGTCPLQDCKFSHEDCAYHTDLIIASGIVEKLEDLHRLLVDTVEANPDLLTPEDDVANDLGACQCCQGNSLACQSPTCPDGACRACLPL